MLHKPLVSYLVKPSGVPSKERLKIELAEAGKEIADPRILDVLISVGNESKVTPGCVIQVGRAPFTENDLQYAVSKDERFMFQNTFKASQFNPA